MKVYMVGFYISVLELPPINPTETQIYTWTLLRIAYAFTHQSDNVYPLFTLQCYVYLPFDIICINEDIKLRQGPLILAYPQSQGSNHINLLLV